ncbi:DUF1378 family protein [Pseudocitrobacter sp. 2023EL-00150]|uniref:DUF1378 family protein n=1 Tax=Pseudocitrobacter sp. 2023EL-00150 TaxID=3032322 RepID=UPI0023E3D3D9|nr:DUF1378 family protein [Pseudocitrobacter sp. 2023EL-00150]MDF3830246.1 DUF1378 family protein [Pseudocitrobacter sp. 2023EL-00150]
MTELLTYFNTVIIVALLIAGGWVRIRDYFRTKAQAKADALEALAKAQEDAIEAKVQERLKKLKADIADSPESTSTSTAGPAVV